MSRKTVTKKEIVSVIYKRYGRSLKRSIIRDAINVVCSMLEEDLLEDRSVSVKNFGTFSPYFFHGHIGYNVAHGKMQAVKAFRDIRFHPHATFLRLLELRRKSFLEREGSRKNSRPSKKN